MVGQPIGLNKVVGLAARETPIGLARPLQRFNVWMYLNAPSNSTIDKRRLVTKGISMTVSETVRTFCQRRSIELSTSEVSAATVAEVLGVTTSTICRWRKDGMPDRKAARSPSVDARAS